MAEVATSRLAVCRLPSPPVSWGSCSGLVRRQRSRANENVIRGGDLRPMAAGPGEVKCPVGEDDSSVHSMLEVWWVGWWGILEEGAFFACRSCHARACG